MLAPLLSPEALHSSCCELASQALPLLPRRRVARETDLGRKAGVPRLKPRECSLALVKFLFGSNCLGRILRELAYVEAALLEPVSRYINNTGEFIRDEFRSCFHDATHRC